MADFETAICSVGAGVLAQPEITAAQPIAVAAMYFW
jgi:hypothetical protein